MAVQRTSSGPEADIPVGLEGVGAPPDQFPILAKSMKNAKVTKVRAPVRWAGPGALPYSRCC
jgi:hypothetical protein